MNEIKSNNERADFRELSATNRFSKIKKMLRLRELPSTLIAVLVFVLPIIFLPISTSSFVATKGFVLLAFVLAAFFVWILLRLRDTSFNIPFNLLTLAILIVPVVYFVSALFSENVGVSLYGRSFSFDSVVAMVFMFALLSLVIILFQDTKKVFRLYIAMFASFFVVAVLHIVRTLFIDVLPSFGFFLTTSTNTVGKWNDLAVYAGLFTIFIMITLHSFSFSKKIRNVLIAGLVLSLFLLALVNFTLVWYMIGVFALLFFIYFLSLHRGNSEGEKDIPFAPLGVLLISFLFILAGNSLGGFLSESLGVSFLEVRPSWSGTIEVIKGSLSENPVFGYGPNRFENAWSHLKPDQINSGDFWNVDFRYGVGLLPTYIVTTGLVGILGWIFFIGLFIYYGFKSVFVRFENQTSKYILVSSFIGGLYLWTNVILFIPSMVTFALTFITTGVFFASLYREGFLRTRNVNVEREPKFGFIFIFALVIILVGVVATGFGVTKKFLANIHFQRALVDLNVLGDIDGAERNIVQSLALHQTDAYFRGLSEINRIRIVQLINDQQTSQEVLIAQFRAALSNAIGNAQAAVAYDDSNYGNYLELGRVYQSVVPLNIEGSYNQAKTAFESAQNLSPKNPLILLFMARLEIAAGNNTGAREFLGQALLIKPNYTDAIFLLSQIDVAEGNIERAIQNVEAASIIRPNDPNVYFQLGLLRYNNRDFNEAIGAFERATFLNPFYSNAKYFLGLSYEKVGRIDDAIVEFKELDVLNPNNQEVKFILSNLENGDSPFANVAPPFDDEPENRDKLPIDEDDVDLELDEKDDIKELSPEDVGKDS